ncbi:M3 family metallopeptidase [Thiotrichales bacterium 19S3-7]|nr:M3 family metallopeptidase [Thiotrichales bacterium 19S3-7]MCF6801567.1 M3 family metallopeptidase [Thiotrichales bacterium 19S3-11]
MTTLEMTQSIKNPLIELPEYSKIDIQHFESQLDNQLEHCRDLRKKLLAENTDYSWTNLIDPLDACEDQLNKLFAPISQLNAVLSDDTIREVYDRCIVKLSEYSTEVSQDELLYQAYVQISQSDAYQDDYDFAKKRIIDEALKHFKLSGVHLAKAEKERFKAISERLTVLSTTFSNNVLDATKAWYYHTEDENDLSGLASHVIEAARLKAESQAKKGYSLGLDAPTYISVMTTADNRALREAMYYEYATRASDCGSNASRWDNTQIINETLALRQEMAEILGYDNYAEVSIAPKMVETTTQVISFLEDLVTRAKPQAEKEYQELCQFAKNRGIDDFKAWDLNYYSEKLKKEKFSFTQEELRPYFPVGHVLSGLFSILNEIYGINVERIDQFDRYHESIELYRFTDLDGQLRGLIYVDLYAREVKRGGAWMDDLTARYLRDNGDLQIPIAYIACNFAPQVNNETPALLTHSDVVTLFHEFGHALHHILTQVNYLPVSGINGVEWDAVELPSQFMENYTWHKESLKRLTKHYQTGESLPEILFDKLVASRYFHSAMHMLRQLEFAIFDFRLHLEYKKHQVDENYVLDLLKEVRNQVAVVIPPEYHRFTHSFSHIFAGGYAAGYFSYKWAEVLSSDAFGLFEESGNVFNREVGLHFLKSILEKGGSQPALDLFISYRGRKPDIQALLRHSGIGSP